jgi:dienelactone hydrolase
MKRVDSDFTSKNTRCAGWLYLPDGKEKPPVVVMAHGFAAQRNFGLEPYAEYFCEKGMAVFVFDYRNFGDSEGSPRNLVNPWRHINDWKAAISHVRTIGGIDAGRLALWGTSFSGGHVMVISAKVGGVRAVVAQVPFVDGISTTLQFPISYQIEGMYHGLRDVFNLILGKAPHEVPAVGEPGTFAMMNTPDAMEGYYALVPANSPMKNAVPARIGLMVPAYRPIMYAGKIRCPVLLMYAKNDYLIPAKSVEKMGARIPSAEVVGLPVKHFEVYTGELFKQVVQKQADFLLRHLF